MFSKFKKDEKGAIAMMFVVAVPFVMATTYFAFDGANLFSTQTKLDNAIREYSLISVELSDEAERAKIARTFRDFYIPGQDFQDITSQNTEDQDSSSLKSSSSFRVASFFKSNEVRTLQANRGLKVKETINTQEGKNNDNTDFTFVIDTSPSMINDRTEYMPNRQGLMKADGLDKLCTPGAKHYDQEFCSELTTMKDGNLEQLQAVIAIARKVLRDVKKQKPKNVYYSVVPYNVGSQVKKKFTYKTKDGVKQAEGLYYTLPVTFKSWYALEANKDYNGYDKYSGTFYINNIGLSKGEDASEPLKDGCTIYNTFNYDYFFAKSESSDLKDLLYCEVEKDSTGKLKYPEADDLNRPTNLTKRDYSNNFGEIDNAKSLLRVFVGSGNQKVTRDNPVNCYYGMCAYGNSVGYGSRVSGYHMIELLNTSGGSSILIDFPKTVANMFDMDKVFQYRFLTPKDWSSFDRNNYGPEDLIDTDINVIDENYRPYGIMYYHTHFTSKGITNKDEYTNPDKTKPPVDFGYPNYYEQPMTKLTNKIDASALKWEQASYRDLSHQVQNGTFILGGMLRGAAHLASKQNDNKTMIVLTDGQIVGQASIALQIDQLMENYGLCGKIEEGLKERGAKNVNMYLIFVQSLGWKEGDSKFDEKSLRHEWATDYSQYGKKADGTPRFKTNKGCFPNEHIFFPKDLGELFDAFAAITGTGAREKSFEYETKKVLE
ncbi:MAG: pilus assembly protein [Campylobacter sp.]|nr:pilus assembly protein [Campylobacter sp.]